MNRRVYTILFFLFCSVVIGKAQVGDSITIDKITFKNHKRSKRDFLLREITLYEGQIVAKKDLDILIEESHDLLMNTLVYDEIETSKTIHEENSSIDLEFKLYEEGLFFAYPYYELLDRNFNEWWTLHNADLGRLSYAAASYITNPTGTFDQITVITQLGFNRILDINYQRPYINKKKTIGLIVDTRFNSTKSLPIRIGNENEQLYLESEQAAFNHIRLKTGLTYKPKIRNKHTFQVGFNHQDINEEVFEANEDFFLGKRKQQYLSAEYSYRIDYRNIKVYPTKGFLLEGQLNKEGFGILDSDLNTLYLTLTASKYISLNKRFSLSTLNKARLEFLNNQIPYYNQQSLGKRDNYVRGYELYALDGDDYFLNKTEIHFLALDKIINWKWMMPLEDFKRMQLQVYLSANLDNAYASHDTNHDLNNTWLTGFGPSLDMIFYGDVFVTAEYSFNHLRENGLFLHLRLDF